MPFIYISVPNFVIMYAVIYFFSLNIKVILLVRDPRAVYSSRQEEFWCQKTKDCSIETYCNQLQSNFNAFNNMKNIFPDQLRFEFRLI